MIKGDILYGRKYSDAIHPIIYLGEHNDELFIGAMLTSASNFEDNVMMKPEHFKITNENDKDFEFNFKNTHLVKAKLLKRNDWRPFKKIGELTKQGIKFVEAHVNTKKEKLWEEYIIGN